VDEISYPLPNLNSVTLAGKVGKALGLVYRKDGKPVVKFTVLIDDENRALGKVFTVAIPCELAGDRAEQLAEDLEMGHRVLIHGRLAYRVNGEQAGGDLSVYAHQVQSLETRRLSGAA
jgi:single-stranded DNA-binding protein